MTDFMRSGNMEEDMTEDRLFWRLGRDKWLLAVLTIIIITKKIIIIIIIYKPFIILIFTLLFMSVVYIFVFYLNSH